MSDRSTSAKRRIAHRLALRNGDADSLDAALLDDSGLRDARQCPACDGTERVEIEDEMKGIRTFVKCGVCQ